MLSRKRVLGTRGVIVILAAAAALLGYNPAPVPTFAAGPPGRAAATILTGALAQRVGQSRIVAAAPTASGTTSPAVSAAARVGASIQAPLSTATVAATLTSSGAAASAYVHYYLWWTDLHWHDKLGSSYPYSATPLPIPGSTDASGCKQTVRYSGSTIVDIPSEGLYNQNLGATFDRHIAAAAAAGVRGFVVSWIGNGTTTQSPTTSSSFNARLDLLVSRVNAYNATHAQPFGLALGMSPYGNYSRPASAIVNDLTYFSNRYATNTAFVNRYGARPLVMLLDSRKFASGTLRTVSTAMRGRLMLLGDETASSWVVDGTLLDGTSYYWSSENPTSSAGASLATLAGEVHAAGKIWLSPFIAGYSRQLLGGSCVPRNGLTTLDSTWAVNGASHPDGWMGISWNEFVENTYLEPSAAYGTRYLDELHRLIAAG